MNINSRNIYIIYALLYFSLLVGFYFNEDFALGYISDYYGNKQFVSLFEKDFVKTLLNFDKFTTSHSPIYYIFVLFLEKISFNETVLRLINLHTSLLIPIFFYLCLKIKYKFQKKDLRTLIPCIIFFSPYFRSSSIWMGSENISLLFLIISFYFFLKYESNKEKNFSNIFLNVLFLACAAYFRPVYAIFSIYFFLRFYLDLKLSTKLLYYILTNILLSLPAIYYVFILDINFITRHVDQEIELSRFVNQFSLTISIIFFYSIPFLLPNIKNKFKLSFIKIENIVLSIIFTYLLLFHFNYNVPYGGGIFYKFSLLAFDNNYLFYFFSLIAFNVLFAVLFFNNDIKDRISNLTLLLVLIFLEPDRYIYHETFDPLLYFVFFLLIKSEIYLNFIQKLTNKKFILLILFSISFYILSIFKMIYNPIEMPMY
jgi:hypothetical protein|tara:strand:+ start:4680 stop:5960 length:1281 start_codon:yes stop_codon:yes gene_type:complete